MRVVEKHPASSGQICTVDWSQFLNDGATISTSAWAVPADLTNVADNIVTGNLKTSIKISGGVAGQQYTLVNTITTSDSETLAIDCPLVVRR